MVEGFVELFMPQLVDDVTPQTNISQVRTSTTPQAAQGKASQLLLGQRAP